VIQRWWQVGTRNWRAKPVRTLLATGAIALGVGLVGWVTGSYESVRRSVVDTVREWIGEAQVTVESVAGRWALFDAAVADGIGDIPGVARFTTRTIETVLIRRPGTGLLPDEPPEVLRLDLVGVEMPREAEFRAYRIDSGRLLRAGEDDGVMVEELLAREWNLAVGDRVELRSASPISPVQTFRIVGLVDRRRVSSHQLPMAWTTLQSVQTLCGYPGKIKAIDVIVADDSDAGLERTADAIRRVVRKRDRTVKVGTTAAQLRQLRSAQAQLQFVLMLMSCVALLTAFFIILSTMNMGVSERINQLGLMRCVGMTRGQLVALVLIEVLPMGVLGTLLGVPIGIALQYITMLLVPEYVGTFALSPTGMALAVGGGIGTAALGALGPAVRAALISPMAATRAAPPRPRQALNALAAAAGVAMLAAHIALLRAITSETPWFAGMALGALVLLYAAYTLLAPLVVSTLGEPLVRLAAWVLRLRRQLVAEQVGRRPWRSAAVCCGLMVGLSLIVALQVHSESVKAGWEFPKQFPEAMIYSWRDVPLDRMRAAARTPGIASATIAADIRCKLVGRRAGFLSALDPFYRYIAGDPDTFPKLIKLVYLEGNEADALARLRQGDHVLVTREFSQARRIHLHDKVTLAVGDTEATFTVAGVVASPAIDIAVSFFNAGGEFQVYAVGSFVGTLADAQRLFGTDSARLLLFNFDLPETESAADGDARFSALTTRPPGGVAIAPADERESAEREATRGHLRAAAAAAGTTVEKQIVKQITDTLASPDVAFVTARQLKQGIDQNIDRVTLLLAAIPTVGLVVAALGVANLMTANIAARQRQIAVLRAVGATQFQMIRLVMAEALILGLLGSLLGVVMGLHLGRSSTHLTSVLWGFQPRFAVPWPMVLAGAAVAIGLCLLAAAAPARIASRSNIVSALQST